MSTSVKRRRKPAQKGVQSVFTPRNNWKEKPRVILGLTAIGAGTGAWTYTTRSLSGFGPDSLIPWNASTSTILLPISMPLLIGGVGLCTYYLAVRRTWRASSRIESALSELEALVGQKNAVPGPSQEARTIPGAKTAGRPSQGQSKALMIALVQAILLFIIYGGLAREYVSNVNMQRWVEANFALGSYLLSYNAVLVLAGLLGVLIFRLLPRKVRSRSARNISPSKTSSLSDGYDSRRIVSPRE